MFKEESTTRVTPPFTFCVAFPVMAERVIDRALRLAAVRGWNQSTFAEKLGVEAQHITNWKSRDLPTSKYESVADALDCTIDELTGRTPMLLPVTAEEERPSFSRGSTVSKIFAWNYESDLPDGEFVFIPRLNIQLSAGTGKEQVEISFSEAQPQAFRADWIRKEGLKPKKLAAMCAAGPSMEPSIWDGDSLVVDTSQLEVVDGKVYALWYEGGERVKRLFRLPGGGLRIQSDNPEFPPIVLDDSHRGDVRIIGRVVHRSGKGGL